MLDLLALIAKWREEANLSWAAWPKAARQDVPVLQTESAMLKKCADELEAALAAPPPEPEGAARNEWRLDDRGLLDDVVVEDVATFRLERMSDEHIWGCVYHRDGSMTDFNIFAEGQISLNYEHEPAALAASPPHPEPCLCCSQMQPCQDGCPCQRGAEAAAPGAAEETRSRAE